VVKSRGRRRKRYTSGSPLRLVGEVHLEELGPDRDGLWPRFLYGFISQVPAFDGSSEGRFKSGLIKIAIGAVAVSLVTAREEHWMVAVAGIAIALLTLFVPLGDTQKFRLLARIRRLREPKSTIRKCEGTLFFDGAKLSLKSEGRTLQSIRPFGDDPARLGLFQTGQHAYLSLTRGKGKKRKALWMRSSVPDWEEWVGKQAPGRIPTNIEAFDLPISPTILPNKR